MTTKKKEYIWKKGKQICVVLISNEEKTYQVSLNNEQMSSLIFILPQLFDDHAIKVLEEPLKTYIEELTYDRKL